MLPFSKLQFLSLFSLFFVPLISATSSSSSSGSISLSNGTTVYQILTQYGLPAGLLPDSVKSFAVSSDTGKFVVELDKPCYIQFDYLVYYDRKITGTLKFAEITDLSGIQVQKFFLWLNVDEIRVDSPPSDYIYFQVGWINKKLSVEQFETVHSCRDGVSSCHGAWKNVLQVPAPVKEITMLVTE